MTHCRRRAGPFASRSSAAGGSAAIISRRSSASRGWSSSRWRTAISRARRPSARRRACPRSLRWTRCSPRCRAISCRSARRRGCIRSTASIAAQRRTHVLTEKPMAISLAAADELVQACDAAGVQLFVVKQNRLNPPIQLLQARDRQGAVRADLHRRTSRCAGRGRRSTTTPSRGAARGSSTAARS